MGHIGPQLFQRLGVQLRAVGRDAPDGQATHVQSGLEVGQEAADVVLGRVVLQDAEGQADEGSVVDQREHAERAIVQLIDGDIAAEAGQCALEVDVVSRRPGFFFPAASTQFWMVAQGTKTRWVLRHKCQLAMR